METYFKTATEAMEMARTNAFNKGFKIAEQDYDNEVMRFARLRPETGVSHSFIFQLTERNTEKKNRFLSVQIYGMETCFELNCYIS